VSFFRRLASSAFMRISVVIAVDYLVPSDQSF
jgi:hypothetical protein